MNSYDDRSPYDRRSEQERTAEELARWIEAGCAHFTRFAGIDGDEGKETAKAIMRPLYAAAFKLALARQFRRTIPVPWLHDASDATIIAKISSPVLVSTTTECADGKRNVLFLGKTGVGKTAAVGLMARNHYRQQPATYTHSCRHGFSFIDIGWITARDLAGAVLAHPLGRGDCPAITDSQKPRILVLDDLGLERDHGAVVDVLWHRYEKNKVTWITSGLTVDEIRERYGESLYRRLVEMGGTAGRVVSCFPKPKLTAAG